MKTTTLHHLADSLADARQHLLAYMLLGNDPAHQEQARCQAYKVGALLDAIRAEIFTRDAHGRRPPGDTRRADRYLKRLLADLIDLGQSDQMLQADDASRACEATLNHHCGGVTVPDIAGSLPRNACAETREVLPVGEPL